MWTTNPFLKILLLFSGNNPGNTTFYARWPHSAEKCTYRYCLNRVISYPTEDRFPTAACRIENLIFFGYWSF